MACSSVNIAADRNPAERDRISPRRPFLPDDRAVVPQRRPAGRGMFGFIEVFQFLLHDHIEQVAAFDRNHSHRGPAANRLQRGMQFFIAHRRIGPPRLEHRRADRGKRIDPPFGSTPAIMPHAIFPLDAEIIVHRIDSLVPEQLAISGGMNIGFWIGPAAAA